MIKLLHQNPAEQAFQECSAVFAGLDLSKLAGAALRIKKFEGEGKTAIRSAADIITSFRIVFAVIIVFARPFSPLFWACCLCGGISDILDGIAARAAEQQSEAGAKFDSAADFIFLAAVLGVLLKNVKFHTWALTCAAFTALLRLTGYGIGFCRYRTFPALHTYANKAAGVLMFLFPLIYIICGLTFTEIILCSAAFLSSAEELIITVKSKELNRERKGLFIR